MNNKIKELFLDNNQRLFICGDLHGTISLLESSLASLGFKEGYDVLLGVGDLVDRGEESEKTLRKFLFDKTGSYFSVRGNHEDFMVDNDWELQLYNGGQWVLDIDEDSRVLYGKLIDQKLPYAIEVIHKGKVYGVVHAEVPIEFSNWDDFCDVLLHNKQLQKECLWNRDIVYGFNRKDKHLEGIDYVFHGHTPMDDSLEICNRVYIDTGATFKDGYLTIVEFDKELIFHKFYKEDK